MALARNNLSIYWTESSVYIALYVSYALIVCLVIVGLELYNQSAEVSMSRVALKALILILTTSICFALSLFISGWHAKLFAYEILTNIVISIAWFILLYKLNLFLMEWINPNFVTSTASAYVPPLLFIAPFILFSVFIQLLASAFKH